MKYKVDPRYLYLLGGEEVHLLRGREVAGAPCRYPAVRAGGGGDDEKDQRDERLHLTTYDCPQARAAISLSLPRCWATIKKYKN